MTEANTLTSSSGVSPAPDEHGATWFAVITRPQNEKSTARNLALRGIESFLPTYESVRQWNNRRRVRLSLPLFSCYLFVRSERPNLVRVLSTPGVLHMVSDGRGPVLVPETMIDVMRSACQKGSLLPYHGFPTGARARIKGGDMKGLEGIVVRQNSNFHFVLTIESINLSVAVEIDPENLEQI